MNDFKKFEKNAPGMVLGSLIIGLLFAFVAVAIQACSE